MQVKRVAVVSSRKVVIEGLKDNQSVGWGALVGATVAGVATYGLTKADTPLGVAVTIIAAIGGAMVGTVIEERKNRHPGAEYILQAKTGAPFAVVQALGSDDRVLGLRGGARWCSTAAAASSASCRKTRPRALIFVAPAARAVFNRPQT